jgi:HPt (histidine-containing phosphotransfer) domain-containing protein
MADLPVFDPAQLRSLLELGAEPALIQELIGLYEADAPERIAALAAAASDGDATRLLAEAHHLKGSLGNLGLVRFAELARRLETAGREGCLEGVEVLVAALPAEHAEGLAALKAAFPA